jgi:GNAT superfamily N-acetyltransferase
MINLFIEQPWRHQGVAMLFLERIIDWAQAEHLGFVGTDEMRFLGD